MFAEHSRWMGVRDQHQTHKLQLLMYHLTNLSRLEFPTVINWTNPFLF